MAEEEWSFCKKCGARAAAANLRRIEHGGEELRLCPLCWNEFWDWYAGRSLHTGREVATPTPKGLALSLCMICRCELERWLKPLPQEFSNSFTPIGGQTMGQTPKKAKGQAKPAPPPAPKPAAPAPSAPQQAAPAAAPVAPAAPQPAPVVPAQAEQKS